MGAPAPKQSLEGQSDWNATLSVVSIKLDESTVIVCRTHQACSFNGRAATPEGCDRRWIYGVGAAVFEEAADLEDLSVRLSNVRESILVRTGIEGSRRLRDFTERGWHATADSVEFAEPLLIEMDRGATFKGHVRYCVSDTALASSAQVRVFDYLFQEVLRVLLVRYKNFGQIHIAFEDDQSPFSRYEKIVATAGHKTVSATVTTEKKGDAALAMADYLLYSALKYLARTMEVCNQTDCGVSHQVPVSSDVSYNEDGTFRVNGHLDGKEHAYRRYAAFVRSMSSVLNLRGAIDGAVEAG